MANAVGDGAADVSTLTLGGSGTSNLLTGTLGGEGANETNLALTVTAGLVQLGGNNTYMVTPPYPAGLFPFPAL